MRQTLTLLTFDEALDEMLAGRMVARIGWDDPDRFVYLMKDNETGHLNCYGITQDDSLLSDWYVVGSIH
jgi:hypothetical protein